MDTKGIFSEWLTSLKETVHKVVSKVNFFTFSLDFFVLDDPNGISNIVKVFPKEFESVQFIRSIDKQSFEIKKIEGRRGKEIKRVLFLFNWLFFFIIFFFFFLRSGLSWLGFFSSGFLFMFFLLFRLLFTFLFIFFL